MTDIKLPSIEEVEVLHRKHAPTAEVFDLVFMHCRIVGDIAMQLAQQTDTQLDAKLAYIGCLLHDIGVHRLYDTTGQQIDPSKYITHGMSGEEVLKAEGYPEMLYRFASHHTGSGLTKKQIVERNLPLPHKDYLAETAEERLVMYADKFHSKVDPPQFNSHAFYADYVSRFGQESVDSFAKLTEEFGKPDLRPLISKYGYTLRDIS